MVGQDQQHNTPAAATGESSPSDPSAEPSESAAGSDSGGAKGGGDATDNPDAKGASGPTPPDSAADADEDDVRRKFRESLNKKRHQQNEQRTAEGGKGTSKVQDGFGPSRSRREFRRKSGG